MSSSRVVIATVEQSPIPARSSTSRRAASPTTLRSGQRMRLGSFSSSRQLRPSDASAAAAARPTRPPPMISVSPASVSLRAKAASYCCSPTRPPASTSRPEVGSGSAAEGIVSAPRCQMPTALTSVRACRSTSARVFPARPDAATDASAISKSSNWPTTRARPSRPSTRLAIASPSIRPSCITCVQPAMVRMSTEASDEAVATIGTAGATSRTVKVTLVLAVSERVVATSRASAARAWR